MSETKKNEPETKEAETKEEPQENVNADTSLEMLIVEAVDYFKKRDGWKKMNPGRWQYVSDWVALLVDKRKLVLLLPSAEDCRFRYNNYTKGTKKKEKQAVFRQLTVKKKTLVNNYTLDDTVFDDFDNPISEKYILEMLTMYWPNGKRNLTPKIVNALYKKIMRCIPTEEKLGEQIKTAWQNRNTIASKEMLEDLEKRKGNVSKTKSITKKKKTTGTAVRLYGRNLEQRYSAAKDQVAREKTVKVISSVPLALPPPPQQFDHFSLNQGSLGICYMVSVIVLFKNEFSILAKLKELVKDEKLQEHKVDKTIVQLKDFLDTDYKSVKFKKGCLKKNLPKLPKSWQKTVHQTDNTTKMVDILSGGDPAFLLVLIFTKLDAWHDSFKVAFNYTNLSDLDVAFGTDGPGPTIYNTPEVSYQSFKNMHEHFELNKEKNISLIEIQFGNSQLQVKENKPPVGYYNPFLMVDRMARLPLVRGFLVSVFLPNSNNGHVIAGLVYNENVNGILTKKVVYCNSWGKGCEDSYAVNEELYNENNNYQITNINFVLRKQNFFGPRPSAPPKNKIFSSDDEDE